MCSFHETLKYSHFSVTCTAAGASYTQN
jgi:hypothetical protein